MKAAAAKKVKPKPPKPKATMQTAMPKGTNEKYDVLYRSTLSLHAKKKPVDKTPQETIMTQNNTKCAAAYKCKAGNMPLSTLHRCIICAFCVHPECGFELTETPTYKAPSSNINLICKACTIGGDLGKFVQNNEISLGLYKVHRFIRPSYPNIELTNKGDDDSDEEDNKKDNDVEMTTDDKANDEGASKSTTTSGDKSNRHEGEGKTNNDNGTKPMDCDDDADKDKLKDDDDDQSVKINNKKGDAETNNDKDETNSSVQMEDNLLYMDLHLNVPKTTENSPMAPIITLSSRLEAWWKGMQEMDGSFKLHTVDPNFKSQKVMHHTKDFPTNKMAELKEFFKGA